MRKASAPDGDAFIHRQLREARHTYSLAVIHFAGHYANKDLKSKLHIGRGWSSVQVEEKQRFAGHVRPEAEFEKRPAALATKF